MTSYMYRYLAVLKSEFYNNFQPMRTSDLSEEFIGIDIEG